MTKTTDPALLAQAAELEGLLPRMLRRLFALDEKSPWTDLPVAQLRICTLLQGGPQSMTTLGEELDISLSAVTQIADRLEKAGLVERVSDPLDRRVKKLQLTVRGTGMMRARMQARVQRAAQALQKISPDMRKTVLEALEMLLDAAAAPDRNAANIDPVSAPVAPEPVTRRS